MSFFTRFLIFAIGFLIGLLILKFLEQIVYTFGKSEWAEQKFGPGGTYTIWQIAAVGIIVVSFLLAMFIPR